MTVAVTRRELSAEGLRREAVCCRDVAAARRMLALALVLEGSSAGMDRQTLRDWVHRYNQAGIAGLRDRPRSGPGASRASRRRRQKSWRRSWSRDPSPTAMGWCAGDGWTCGR